MCTIFSNDAGSCLPVLIRIESDTIKNKILRNSEILLLNLTSPFTSDTRPHWTQGSDGKERMKTPSIVCNFSFLRHQYAE